MEPARNLLDEFHGDILLDETVSDPNAVLLSIYMAANKEGKNKVSKSHCVEIFEKFGRDASAFSKALYELNQRQERNLIRLEDDRLSLNFSGKKRVEGLLEDRE